VNCRVQGEILAEGSGWAHREYAGRQRGGLAPLY
jgi:hypothetical protein